MTTTDQIEQRLERVFRSPMPGELEGAMDARIASVVGVSATPVAVRASRRWVRLVAVAVTAVALIGTAAFGYEAFQQIVGADGWRVAWQRSERIGLADTANGHEVVLERAYADGAQVVLGVSAPSMVDAISHSGLSVTDDLGRTYWAVGGTGTNVEGGSIVVYGFLPDTPLPAGLRQFTVTMSANGAPETWSWTFPLTVAAAATTAVGVTATVADISIRVGNVVISPTTARVALVVDAGSHAAQSSDWAPIGVLRRDGTELSLQGSLPEMLTYRGVDDPQGTWELVISELVGTDSHGKQLRLKGPWIVQFEVP